MYFAEDENFARRLQNELNAFQSFNFQSPTKTKENANPIDSKLELIDPTPSIHDLFVKFDKKFFWSSLGMVQVVWSNRMTTCAGMCYFQGKRGLCKISLSAPLLSLRPRKDLVETLLHEMIHAYLFVTDNYSDREDHGPQFHKHMYRINREAGTNITVYHSFLDEVSYYQKHIWRCNGPCQKKKPYFGFIKRAMNRAPGPSDSWWKGHKLECNGTFIKISGPEEKPKKMKKIKISKVKKGKDIRNFFTPINSPSVQTNVKTLADLKVNQPVCGVKSNNGGTLVITNAKDKKNVNIAKSHQLQDAAVSKKVGSVGKNMEDSEKVRDTVRNIWANKFSNITLEEEQQPSKKLKLECPVCGGSFEENEMEAHVEDCLQRVNMETGGKNEILDSSQSEEELKLCPVCNDKIKHSEMNEHLESCLMCSFVNEEENNEDEVVCDSVPCPCCYQWFLEDQMNSHLDYCLTLNALKEEMTS